MKPASPAEHRRLQNLKVGDRFARVAKRDQQRGRLYQAEDAMRNGAGISGRQFHTLQDVVGYADQVTGSRWWAVRFPFAPARVHVKDGRGRRTACAWLDTISLPAGWARCELVVLHELAHVAARCNAGHGWYFARVMHDLVAWRMGQEAGDFLRDSFRTYRVRWTPPRPKRELTDAARGALAARLAAIRGAAPCPALRQRTTQPAITCRRTDGHAGEHVGNTEVTVAACRLVMTVTWDGAAVKVEHRPSGTTAGRS